MLSDDRGIADAMYTMLSVAIVMIMAIAISGVVMSTTMKQGTDANAKIAAYDTGGMIKGACALYFTIDSANSDFAATDPDKITLKSSAGERVDETISFSRASAPSYIPASDGCVIWSGYVCVPADGTYVFRLTSRDGSWLWIDGNLTIDDHGVHALQTVNSNGIALTKGYHLVKVRYFYRDLSTASCTLCWNAGKSGNMETVSALYR